LPADLAGAMGRGVNVEVMRPANKSAAWASVNVADLCVLKA
jgi:hypothetical protein